MYPNIICYSRGDDIPNEYIKINTTSHSNTTSKKLSPFFLGPVLVEPIIGKVFTSENFENAWQYSKQYEKYEDINKYLEWAAAGFKSKKADRYPMGNGAKPMHSLYKGQKLGYIESRFKIYAPLYEECVLKYAKDEFDKIKELYDSGKKIALFDFDGYGYHLADMKLEDVIYNDKKKMGHSFILIGMITGNRFWNKEYDETKIFSQSVPRYK